MECAREGRACRVAGGSSSRRRAHNTLADYVDLTKPRLNFLVVADAARRAITSARAADLMRLRMAEAVAGTALVAGGAAVLNQVYERDTDALMRRTRRRPLPDGRVGPSDATMFGAALSFAGLALLGDSRQRHRRGAGARHARRVPGVYTPMKRRTSARDARRRGAGRAAAAHRLDGRAADRSTRAARRCSRSSSCGRSRTSWPSRGCTATITRRAGFPMLPVIEPDGRRAARQAVVYAAALLPVSLAPTFTGIAGPAYFFARRRSQRGRCWRSRSASRARAMTRPRGRCSSGRSRTCRCCGSR